MPTAERRLCLRDYEVRQLLDTGNVTVVRKVRLPKWATECCENPKRVLVPNSTYLKVCYCESCGSIGKGIDCPLGSPGEVRWVAETWAFADWTEDCEPWRSSTTMPRWASRLSAECVAVRVERDDSGQWVWVTDYRRVS